MVLKIYRDLSALGFLIKIAKFRPLEIILPDVLES